MSASLRVKNAALDQATASGSDRLFHMDDVSKLVSGSTVCEIAINAGSFGRLSVLSRAYQRVEFVRLNIQVTAFSPTTTGGGYVCAFVADPDDATPDANLLQWLTAQQGSVTTKWWQNSTIQCRPARQWYFTSPGVEVREFSPGRFVLAVDTRATQVTGVTVWAHWTVRLSKATLESAPTIKSCVALRDLYTQNGHKGLFYKDGQDFKDDNKSMFSVADTGTILIMPFPLQVMLTVSSADKLRTAWWVKLTSENDALFCLEKATDVTNDACSSELLVIRKGTVMELYREADALQGEARGPSESISSGANLKNFSGSSCDEHQVGSNSSRNCQRFGNQCEPQTSCSVSGCQTSTLLEHLVVQLASMVNVPLMEPRPGLIPGSGRCPTTSLPQHRPLPRASVLPRRHSAGSLCSSWDSLGWHPGSSGDAAP